MARVLTCRPCNNEAGSRFEGHLKRRRVAEDFGVGQLSAPTPVTLEVAEGARTRAEVVPIDGGLRVVGIPQASNPADVAATREWWDRQVAGNVTDATFTIHLPGYHHDLSRVALLKAAYLAAFAAFGYGYIWLPQLDIVRTKVRHPDDQGDQQFATVFAPDLDRHVHRVLIAVSPLRALCLQIGQDVVVLPWLDSPPVFWDRMSELVDSGGEAQFTFDGMREWPRFPEYRLDFPQEDPRSVTGTRSVE